MPALALPLVLSLLAQSSAPASPRPHATLEGITEHRLENGLQVLLIPDASQPTVTVNLTVFAGSAAESYGETGAAHLLEHLAFKGSPEFPNVPGALNEHGASWNGTTWTDRTNYFETMPASNENVDFGIRFEAARLSRSFIRKSDLDSEMTVVRNEFEAGENSPTGVLSERMVSTAYLFHGYQHSTIGARSDLEGMPIERLQGFYRKWYRPDNAMLVVAGRFDGDKALASVARHFGAIPRPAEPLARDYTVEPPQDGEREVVLRRVGEVGAAGAVYHVPAASHADAAAIEVASEVLGATPTGRLYRALVETGKAVRVETTPFQWRDPSVFQVLAEVRRDGDLGAVRQEMLGIVEGLGGEAAAAAEVEAAKNALRKRSTLLFGNSQRLAVEMSEWAALGDWRLFFVHRDRVAAVTPADVKRVAAAYFRRNNRTAGTFQPTAATERVEIPAASDFEAAVAALADRAPGTELAAETIAIDGAVLEARTRRIPLASGGRLALLPRETRGDLVTGRLSLAVGNLADLASKLHLNAQVADMLSRGTAKRSRSALKQELDRLQADLRVSGSPNETVLTFTTTRDNLPAVAALAIEMLREPAFDPAEIEVLRGESLARLEEGSREPAVLAGVNLNHHLYPEGHLRHSPTIAEQIAQARALDAARLRDFHRDFYGAAALLGAVVGDFDERSLVAAIETSTAGWASARPAERIAPAAIPGTAPLVRAIETPDKENAVTAAGRTLQLGREDARYHAFLLANFLVGGEPLNSRLGVRLRQKDGLCYGVRSRAEAELAGELASFTFWAISAPQNAERVEQGFREEIERARVEGFTEAEVKRARSAYLERRDVSLARDAGLATEMVEHLVRGKTFAELTRDEEALGAVAPAQVNSVVRELLDPAAMALFRVGDFARVKAQAPPATATKGE